MGEINELTSKEVLQRMPLSLKIRLWISRHNPFASEFDKLGVIFKHAIPWLMGELLRIYKEGENVNG